jgi:hypothetical protein
MPKTLFTFQFEWNAARSVAGRRRIFSDLKRSRTYLFAANAYESSQTAAAIKIPCRWREKLMTLDCDYLLDIFLFFKFNRDYRSLFKKFNDFVFNFLNERKKNKMAPRGAVSIFSSAPFDFRHI